MSVWAQTCERIRAGETTDRAGNIVVDWDTPDVMPMKHLSIQPNSQKEDETDLGDVRITSYRIITKPGTTPDVKGTDRIVWNTTTYKVEGEVGHWPDPRGRGHDHLEFIIREIKGGSGG